MTTRRKAIAVLLLVSFMLAAGCGDSESEINGAVTTRDDRAEYDQDVQDLKDAVKEFENPETYDSIQSLQAAFRKVQTAYDSAVESGKKVKDARVSEVEDAYNELKESVTNIESDQTLEQKVDAVKAALQKFSNDLKSI